MSDLPQPTPRKRHPLPRRPPVTLDTPLPPRMSRFALEYVVDLDGAAAYQRAGYKTTSLACRQAGASRCLRDPRVARAIAGLKAERERKATMDGAAVIRTLEELVRVCMTTEPVYSRDGELIPGVYRKDSQGAAKALELLGKHHGVFERDNIQTRPQLTFVEVMRPQEALPGAPVAVEAVDVEVLPSSSDSSDASTESPGSSTSPVTQDAEG